MFPDSFEWQSNDAPCFRPFAFLPLYNSTRFLTATMQARLARVNDASRPYYVQPSDLVRRKAPPCGKFDPIGTRKRTGLHEWIVDSHPENFLPVVHVFGVQHRRTGPRRRHNHQCIPE